VVYGVPMSLNDELREDPYYLQSYQTQLLTHQNEHLEDMEAPSSLTNSPLPPTSRQLCPRTPPYQ